MHIQDLNTGFPIYSYYSKSTKLVISHINIHSLLNLKVTIAHLWPMALEKLTIRNYKNVLQNNGPIVKNGQT